MEKFPCGVPILFRTPVWVSLKTDTSVSILLQPLTYDTLVRSQESAYIASKDRSMNGIVTSRQLLEQAIIDSINAINFTSIQSLVAHLSKEDVIYLYTKLIEISDVSQEQLRELEVMLDIQFNPRFHDENWDCSTCQRRGFDKTRACGFLPEEEREPGFFMKVNGKHFSMCPLSTLDNYALQQAHMAHQYLDAGVMPEEGGIGQQTSWFVKVALLYKRKLKQAEKVAYEEMKQKR